jgi:ethanolamine permease
MSDLNNSPKLERTLGPVMLWGLGVGYVISGMYFGWNLGLAEGGTLGLGIATLFIIVMYVTFTFSYTELACAIPKAGGAFDYADRALGRNWGFLGGLAQIIEFVFAPPAIAAAIGAYFQLFLKSEPTIIELGTLSFGLPWLAILAYFAFTALNIAGVKAAAMFELVITILAVAELLIFAGVTLPSFEVANLTTNALPNGIPGIFAAIPFAIWFFLAIEGVANVAEETVNPQRNVLLGFGSAILTLVILCVLTFISSVGVAGWEAVVYDTQGNPSDSPLPLALAHVVGDSGAMYHLLLTIGLLGLVASFHGIILAAGRATYEFGRMGLAPRLVGKVHPKFRTPANALIFNMVIGIVALMTGKTGEIITIACFGALALYIISMVSFFFLRKNEPDMERPFRVPFYPLFPALALSIATFSIIAMAWYNAGIALVFLGIMGVSFVGYLLFIRGKSFGENGNE